MSLVDKLKELVSNGEITFEQAEKFLIDIIKASPCDSIHNDFYKQWSEFVDFGKDEI